MIDLMTLKAIALSLFQEVVTAADALSERNQRSEQKVRDPLIAEIAMTSFLNTHETEKSLVRIESESENYSDWVNYWSNIQ